MAQNALPGSMDLLLDTMCNTFGGVMFITISVALTVFITKIELNPQKVEKNAEQLIAQREQEIETLKKKQQVLLTKIRQQQAKQLSLAAADPELEKQVMSAGQKLRELQRECAFLSEENEITEVSNRNASNCNLKTEAENSAKSKEMKNTFFQLEKNLDKLKKKAMELQSKLASIPEKKVHFAREHKNNKQPIVVILADNKFYFLGPRYHFSSPEVDVKHLGHSLKLTLKRGRSLAQFTPQNFNITFNPGLRGSYFVKILAHSDSMKALVTLRRMLRNHSWEVNWSVQDIDIMWLTSSPVTYSSSN